MQLNRPAFAFAESLLARAGQIGCANHVVGGVRVLDCGVRAAGGTEAGLGMATAAMATLGEVAVDEAGAGDGVWPGCPWPTVRVASARPVAACLAAQYAGWRVSEEGYFAMASGPIRAAIGREDLFDCIGSREPAGEAVCLLESDRLPPATVCARLATDAGVPPDRLIVLVARTASPAGTLQVVARSLETALHKLHDLRFDVGRVVAGSGQAPLPPVPADDLTAIGRTNDAILYGGHVVLDVTGDDASLEAIGPRMVSAASSAFGEPFLRLFEAAGRDFYALDPALFAPASVELRNVETGRRHRFGRLAPEIVERSFGGGPARPGA